MAHRWFLGDIMRSMQKSRKSTRGGSAAGCWHIRFRIILRFPECGQGHGSVRSFFLFPAQPCYICLENEYIPTMPDGDDSVFIEYQLVGFFSKPFIILYKVEYLSDIFNVYSFG
jgi:hypothetical protein